MYEERNYIRQTDYYCLMKQLRGEWVPNFEEGKIYSTVLNAYITPYKNTAGYLYVRVSMMEGIVRQIYLHRALLIMKTGLPVDPRLEVDHINHNPADNRISNLRWVTPSENQRNRPERFAVAESIRREKEAGASTAELAKRYGYSPSMIRRIVAGSRYDPKKYPGDTVLPHLHYSHPASGGAFLRWFK